MLHTTLDDELLETGYSREIVNRIQKLRKTSGISIEDRIEVFYETTAQDAPLDKVIKNTGESIISATKMPFLKKSCAQEHAIFVGETSYSNEKDSVKLYIYMEAPQFDEEKLLAKYGHLNKDKVNFT